MRVAVVDYGVGNLHSVRNALWMAGADVQIVDTPAALVAADRVVLPGVGAFGQCVANLRGSGMLETLEEVVLRKARPLLGICVGMQILADAGEEMGEHQGLGWVPGRVRRLNAEAARLRVPHVGWNEVELTGRPHPVLAGGKPGATFYFVHSYAFEPVASEHAIAECRYGDAFTCAVAKDNIVATQFHPEKSQQNGLAMLERFIAWNP